jgi:hypothetical protein
MARSDTASGVTAYTSEQEFTGPGVWTAYKNSLRRRAIDSLGAILATKGQKYGVAE